MHLIFRALSPIGDILYTRDNKVQAMSNFERELVKSFNDSFNERRIDAIAYRVKQHRFSQQMLDILVDSHDRQFYLGIECKSVSPRKGLPALYFSQHFTVDKKGDHQVAKMNSFIKRSGRSGFLAVELRMGSGKSKAAHFVPWPLVWERYNAGQPGFPIRELESINPITRIDGRYAVEALF
ncbi:MAG: hypothetical protein ACXVI3_04875 [Halobacteriota archaeon]